MTLPTTQQDQLIELDSRRRTTLRLGRHNRYLLHEEPDGTLILKPAVIVTQDELALLSDPALVERIDRSMRNPAARTNRERPALKE